MPYGLYISAEGAAAQARRLEVIANNMANTDTVGFKQDVPTFQARYAEAIQRGLASPGDKSINNIGGGVKMYDIATNFSEGNLRHDRQGARLRHQRRWFLPRPRRRRQGVLEPGRQLLRSTPKDGSSPAKATSRCSISSFLRSRSTAICLGT